MDCPQRHGALARRACQHTCSLGVSKPRRSFDLSTTAAESWRGLPSIGVAGLERSRAVDWRASTCAAALRLGKQLDR